MRNCISQSKTGNSQLFHHGFDAAAAPGYPAKKLGIIRAGRALPGGWGGFGEPSPHPIPCSALQEPELDLGAKSLLQHRGAPETPEMLKLKAQELSEL